MNQLLLEIFQTAKQINATDVHLKSDHPPIFRVNKGIQFSNFKNLEKNDILLFGKDLLDPTQYQILKKNRQIDFSVSISGISRFRGNAFIEQGNLGFVFRQIPFSVPTLSELNIETKWLRHFISGNGLFLVTGPTGSGKSTTISSILNHLNKEKPLRIVTLEDPIEYLLIDDKCDFNQREFGSDFFSFHDGLRSALRQDPDVIVVGEMRDMETIKMGLMAAETGHLVISTLHTGNTAETIERIVSVFPGDEQLQIREQFSQVCRGIMSQQLISRMDGKGVASIREILIFDTAVRNLVLGSKFNQITLHLESNNEKGTVSLNQSLEKAYRDKLISLDSAIAYSDDPDILIDRLERIK